MICSGLNPSSFRVATPPSGTVTAGGSLRDPATSGSLADPEVRRCVQDDLLRALFPPAAGETRIEVRVGLTARAE